MRKKQICIFIYTKNVPCPENAGCAKAFVNRTRSWKSWGLKLSGLAKIKNNCNIEDEDLAAINDRYQSFWMQWASSSFWHCIASKHKILGLWKCAPDAAYRCRHFQKQGLSIIE